MVRDILSDKYVPIYKMLPGFRDEGTNIVLMGNQLVAGGDPASRRLDKQTLTVNQLVFGLLRYKEIVREANPLGGAPYDIDRHIANIIQVSMKYSGMAYFLYHVHIWTHFFGKANRSWGSNWVQLDPAALHSAISGAGVSSNSCAECLSFYHVESVCPFTVRKGADRQGSQSAGNVCSFFNNTSGCKLGEACRYSHVCSVCRVASHSAVNCKKRPAWSKLGNGF